MKIDYVRPNISFSKPRFEFYKGGEWVIDERGFKKTPPYQLKPSNSRELKVSGQVKTPCNVGREWKPINTRNLEWKNF